jgi:hypothetical protein
MAAIEDALQVLGLKKYEKDLWGIVAGLLFLGNLKYEQKGGL